MGGRWEPGSTQMLCRTYTQWQQNSRKRVFYSGFYGNPNKTWLNGFLEKCIVLSSITLSYIFLYKIYTCAFAKLISANVLAHRFVILLYAKVYSESLPFLVIVSSYFNNFNYFSNPRKRTWRKLLSHWSRMYPIERSVNLLLILSCSC